MKTLLGPGNGSTNFNGEAGSLAEAPGSSRALVPNPEGSARGSARVTCLLPGAWTFRVEHDRTKHRKSPRASPAAGCRRPLGSSSRAAAQAPGWGCGALYRPRGDTTGDPTGARGLPRREVQHQGGQRGKRFAQSHKEAQMQAFQSRPFGTPLPLVNLKKENENPSHTHALTKLMNLKCQGTSFADDPWRGPRNVFTRPYVFLQFPEVN